MIKPNQTLVNATPYTIYVSFLTHVKQVRERPGGRCHMRPYRINAEYRLSQKQITFAGEMHFTMCRMGWFWFD